jgi:hypothetical protein
MRIWVADSIASGMRPWFTKFCGQIFDDRWLPVVESIYRFHHTLEPYMRDQHSLAQVGLVYSQQTARWYGGDNPRETVEHHLLGVYHALIEARVPFDMVHSEDLSRIATEHGAAADRRGELQVGQDRTQALPIGRDVGSLEDCSDRGARQMCTAAKCGHHRVCGPAQDPVVELELQAERVRQAKHPRRGQIEQPADIVGADVVPCGPQDMGAQDVAAVKESVEGGLIQSAGPSRHGPLRLSVVLCLDRQ